jgi:hypothetical protein
LLPENHGGEFAAEGQFTVTVDLSTKWAFRRSIVLVNMNPLTITRAIGIPVNPRLVDGDPVAHAQLETDELLKGFVTIPLPRCLTPVAYSRRRTPEGAPAASCTIRKPWPKRIQINN